MPQLRVPSVVNTPNSDRAVQQLDAYISRELCQYVAVWVDTAMEVRGNSWKAHPHIAKSLLVLNPLMVVT